MMRPNPAACIAGNAAWVQAKAETRLTASSLAQSSGVVSVKNACWSTPALLTTISNGPCCAMIACTMPVSPTSRRTAVAPTCPARPNAVVEIEISDHDVSTGIGKASHDRRTNALRAARDEGAAAVEPPERPRAGGRHRLASRKDGFAPLDDGGEPFPRVGHA